MVNINLLPWREERKAQQKKGFYLLLGVFVSISVALLLMVHFLMASQMSIQAQNNQLLRKEIKALDNQIAEIAGLQKEKKQLLARMEIIQRLQGNRPNVVRLFDNFVRIIPDGLYLTSVTRAGNRVLLEGSAESNTRVSSLMRNIENSDCLQEPVLNDIQADDSDQSLRLVDFHLQSVQTLNQAPEMVSNSIALGME